MEHCKAKTKGGKSCKNSPIEGSDYCHIKSHQEQDESKLNPRQEKFCQHYVSKEFFANGVQAYIEAYDIVVESQKDYNSACAAASRLLSNVNICDRINDLLDEAGLNDNFVDKELLFLIQQHADYKSKLGSIREYNKLKSRITDKIEHSGSIGGQIVISGAPVDPKEWQKLATTHMQAMLKLVDQMKEAVDGSEEAG